MTDARAVRFFPRLQCGWCAAVLGCRHACSAGGFESATFTRPSRRALSPGARGCGTANEGRGSCVRHLLACSRCAQPCWDAPPHSSSHFPLGRRMRLLPTTGTSVTLETIDVNPTSTRLGTAVPSRPAREREPQRRAPVLPAAGPTQPAVPGAVVVEKPSGIVTDSTDHRRIDDGHHRGRHRTLAKRNGPGHPGARARRSGHAACSAASTVRPALSTCAGSAPPRRTTR